MEGLSVLLQGIETDMAAISFRVAALEKWTRRHPIGFSLTASGSDCSEALPATRTDAIRSFVSDDHHRLFHARDF